MLHFILFISLKCEICAAVWKRLLLNSLLIAALGEDVQSPPSQRRRTDDSTSTGDLQPLPTSPPADMQSPNVQDTLFSTSPQLQHSGTFENRQVSNNIKVNVPVLFLVKQWRCYLLNVTFKNTENLSSYFSFFVLRGESLC